MEITKSILRGMLKTFRCKNCGYIWNSRRPHSRFNPPSRCPKCAGKL